MRGSRRTKRIGSRTLKRWNLKTDLASDSRRIRWKEEKETNRSCDLRFVRSQVSPARRIVTFGSFSESRIAKMGLPRYSVDAFKSSDNDEESRGTVGQRSGQRKGGEYKRETNRYAAKELQRSRSSPIVRVLIVREGLERGWSRCASKELHVEETKGVEQRGCGREASSRS